MDQHSLTRRQVLRVAGGLALSGTAVMGLAGHASAGVNWCRLDPIVEIDGKRIHIYVFSNQDDMHTVVTGPTKVTVFVPIGSSTEFIWADDGFGMGYAVTFEEDKKLQRIGNLTAVRTVVRVPASEPNPVKVEIERAGNSTVIASKSGNTNEDLVSTFAV